MAHANQVFISYDQEDDKFAHRLANDLKALGVRVWIAPESIGAGEGWVEAINCGLEESDFMIVVLTSAAVDSKWVQKEIEVAVALERKGRIRLILLDVGPSDVPPLWSSYQMILFRHEYRMGLSQLADVLGLLVSKGKDQPLPQDALPLANGKRCPSCGRDIGTLSIIKALTPNKIHCPHCGVGVGYEIGYGVVIALLLLALPLVVLGAYALELGYLGIFMLIIIIALIVELIWAAYLRSNKQLRVIRSRR